MARRDRGNNKAPNKQTTSEVDMQQEGNAAQQADVAAEQAAQAGGAEQTSTTTADAGTEVQAGAGTDAQASVQEQASDAGAEMPAGGDLEEPTTAAPVASGASAGPAVDVGPSVSAAPTAAATPTAPAGQQETSAQPVISPILSNALQSIRDYMENMKPGKPMTADNGGARNQVSLYRALLSIINSNDPTFKAAYSTVLGLFYEHDDGVFRETHVFRFFDQIQLPENDRKAFQRLLNLIKLTADPKSRKIVLSQINMQATLEYGVTEVGRQNILNFYGV